MPEHAARGRVKEQTLLARRDVWRAAALDAGAKLFGDRGFQATTIDDIAGYAGLTRRAFYEVFASKDHLLIAVLDGAAQRIASSLVGDATEAQTAIDRFLSTIEAFLIAADTDRDAFLLYAQGRSGISLKLGDGLDPFDQFETEFHVLVRDLAQDALHEAGVTSPPADLLAHSVIATIRTAALQAVRTTPHAPIADRLASGMRDLYAPLFRT